MLQNRWRTASMTPTAARLFEHKVWDSAIVVREGKLGLCSYRNYTSRPCMTQAMVSGVEFGRCLMGAIYIDLERTRRTMGYC